MIGMKDVRLPSAGSYITVRTVENILLLSNRSKDNPPHNCPELDINKKLLMMRPVIKSCFFAFDQPLICLSLRADFYY